jgi:hypothetical protein
MWNRCGGGAPRFPSDGGLNAAEAEEEEGAGGCAGAAMPAGGASGTEAAEEGAADVHVRFLGLIGNSNLFIPPQHWNHGCKWNQRAEGEAAEANMEPTRRREKRRRAQVEPTRRASGRRLMQVEPIAKVRGNR